VIDVEIVVEIDVSEGEIVFVVGAVIGVLLIYLKQIYISLYYLCFKICVNVSEDNIWWVTTGKVKTGFIWWYKIIKYNNIIVRRYVTYS